MNRKGIEFSLRQIEPDLWKWQFQIGDTVMTGQTRTRLMGMAAHRVRKRIDTELKKQCDLDRQPGMPLPPTGTVKPLDSGHYQAEALLCADPLHDASRPSLYR